MHGDEERRDGVCSPWLGCCDGSRRKLAQRVKDALDGKDDGPGLPAHALSLHIYKMACELLVMQPDRAKVCAATLCEKTLTLVRAEARRVLKYRSSPDER